MTERLQSLIRRVFMSSMGALFAAAPGSVESAVPDASPSNETDHAWSMNDGTVVLKQSRPKLILTKLSETARQLYTSHRSHRSHSSHRSHYSSASPAPRAPARDTTPRPAVTAPTVAQTLGSRVLRKGMSGSDVAELMLILLNTKHLKEQDINIENTFTEAVEQAVKAFQTAKSLTPTGEVNAATLLYLRAGK
jgi:murein L,D-transpeptidase YcbB/YkuD